MNENGPSVVVMVVTVAVLVSVVILAFFGVGYLLGKVSSSQRLGCAAAAVTGRLWPLDGEQCSTI